jgi:cytosine/creatinine deaminase
LSIVPTIPEGGSFTLADATVPAVMVDGTGLAADADGCVRVDIRVEDGRIAAVTAAGANGVRLGGRMVWPSPLDMHTHLDKGHIWPRAANPDGSFMGALETVQADRRAHWRAEDVAARMDFSLRCAFAHGTAAIRTHLDSIQPQAAISWPVFSDMREKWRGRIELQAVSLISTLDFAGDTPGYLADLVAEHRGVMGLVPVMEDGLEGKLHQFFELAGKRGLDCDLHVDESEDPAVRTLEQVARSARRTGFRGRITCGHCCSLAVQPEAYVNQVLDLLAEAGIAIVSLPMCNMYLQDRHAGRTPRWRGVTLLHEMRARGIEVAVASDNTRDPFYAFGDLDLVEVFREAVRILHLDHPFGDWPALVGRNPGSIMGLEDRGVIRVGAPADLVIMEGRRFSEVLSRPQARRTVLRGGKPVDTTPPDYAELDAHFR